MNTLDYCFNSSRVKVAPSHSFHPNASLFTQRKGYVAGVMNKQNS